MRLYGIDYLRGAAALSVMLAHFNVLQHGGQLGVELFFIISGFAIFKTLDKLPTITHFIWGRFARLYPTYLFMTVVLCLANPYAWTWKSFVLNLTMASPALGAPYINETCWTLMFELAFYALAMVTVLAFNWRKPELPCLTWMILELAVRAKLGSDTLEGLAFSHLFTIGIMLYRLRNSDTPKQSFAVLLVALLVTQTVGPVRDFPVQVPIYTIAILWMTLVVWFASKPMPRIAVLQFFGTISYPLYLCHSYLGETVYGKLDQVGVLHPLSVGIAIVVMIATAWLLSAFIEWPAHKWLSSVGRSPPNLIIQAGEV